MTTTTEAEPQASPPTQRGDRIFAGLARGAGLIILAALAAVFIFLAVEGIPGINKPAGNYAPLDSFWPYVGRLLFGTIFAALIALVIAVPFALGIALFISHYAPRALAVPVAYVIDLLAAVPSVVFGLWGARDARRRTWSPCRSWLDDHLGFIPFFKGPASVTGKTVLTAGIVLAIMILPIITAICREIFAQTPRLHEEAALALGATRWEMIRLRRLPLRPLRHGLRGDARPRPGARRDHGGGHGALGQPGDHPQHDLQHQPGDDRLQHRLELPGGHAGQAGGADRDRPGAVRVHLRGQLRGPLRSWPAASGSSTR